MSPLPPLLLPSRWGAVMAGSAAHARTDVKLVVDVNTPHRHAQSAPVFVQHQQVPVHARTVHTRPHTVQFDHGRDRFDHNNRRGGMVMPTATA